MTAVFLASTGIAIAQEAFDKPAAFSGNISISAPDRMPLYPGGTAEVNGKEFEPGQIVTIERGDTKLLEAVTVDDSGAFTARFKVPADAELGLHPVVVKTDGPDSARVVDVKISPDIAPSGEDMFQVTRAQLGGGLYQLAVSNANNTVFVTSSVGRPPVKDSKLFKLDADTLEVLAEITPAETPANDKGETGVFAVYGAGVDDENGNVWVTNTRQNTVAVYSQQDLSLVKQFPEGSARHARDVVIDETRDRAYVSGVSDVITVIDTASLDITGTIQIPSALRRQSFSAMSLALDEEAGLLYTVSLSTPEVARIDLESGDITIWPVAGMVRVSGVDVSADGKRIFVTSQNGDDLRILDAQGNEVNDVLVGAQPLNVVFDENSELAFVANRGSDSLAVVSAAGEIVANLPGGPAPNFVEERGDGVIYMVNKAKGEAENSNTVWRIQKN